MQYQNTFHLIPALLFAHSAMFVQATRSHKLAELTKLVLYSFEDAHGPLSYNMTNDYLFRAVLQRNNFFIV